MQHDLGLSGRTILVVGAAQGIGRATAGWLASLGADVVLADVKACTAAAAEIGHGARAEHVDLTDPSDIEALVARVDADSALYGLVNCAGLLIRRPLEAATSEEIDQQTAVNQSGAFYLARAALSVMAARDRGGRIVLFSSQGGFTGGYFGSVPYAMNKAAVIALVKSLARAGATHGITVNAVAPGGIDTAMLRTGMSEFDLAEFVSKIPMQRMGTTDDIAGPVAFLLSRWANYITGATMHVNGGQFMA